MSALDRLLKEGILTEGGLSRAEAVEYLDGCASRERIVELRQKMRLYLGARCQLSCQWVDDPCEG